MAKVEWIKINVDMFDNRKLRHLRRLPDGNNILLIWVMLLTMAGRCNAGGMIFLTENIPYTPKMIADELDFPENTVNLAIQAMEQLDMLHTNEEGFLEITGWAEHQNVDGMDKIREQNRLRKQKQREQSRLPEGQKDMSRDCHVTVTECHAAEEEREEERDREGDRENKERYSDAAADAAECSGAAEAESGKKKKPEKHRYGEYKNVLLTDKEYKTLTEEYTQVKADNAIAFLDEYIEYKGYKAKSHYLAMRNWVFDAMQEKRRRPQPARQTKSDNPFLDYLEARA